MEKQDENKRKEIAYSHVYNQSQNGWPLTTGEVELKELAQDYSPTNNRNSNLNLFANYLTRQGLATALGKSVRTVDRLEVLRIGPPRIRLGKTILYRIEAVHAWLASLEQPQHRNSLKTVGRESHATRRNSSRTTRSGRKYQT